MKRCRVVVFFCLLLSFFSGSPLAQTNWQWQYPPQPQGNPLFDVDFYPNSNYAMAVGDFSTVMYTNDKGATWSVTTNAAGLDVPLRAVFMIDGQTATAVGENGTILRITNGGATITQQTSGTSADLLDVIIIDVNTGYVVGSGGTILKTTDGGTTWIPQTSGTSATLRGISFVSATTGTVVGSGGTILRTINGGTDWIPQISGTSNVLKAVQFANADNGVAVGWNLTVLKTTNGGDVWSSVSTPPWSGDTVDLLDVKFPTLNYVHIIGTFEDYGRMFTYFLRTENGGSSWDYDTATNHMFSLSMSNLRYGLAVGEMGMIRGTTDFGVSWPIIGGPSSNQTMKALDFWGIYKGVAVTSTNDGGPVFNMSTILTTDDGGETWLENPVDFRLLDIAYADETTIYAVGHGPWVMDMGYVVFRSTDGGVTWVWIWSSFCAPDGSGCDSYIGFLNSIDFGSPVRGVAVGSSGGILRIWDGIPAKVVSNTTKTLRGVSMPDENTAYAVGVGGRIMKSITGGNSWFRLTSGTVAPLNGVDFVDVLHGTVVGDGGTILYTSDGGATWTPQISGTTDNLHGVSFSSLDVGFIVGGAGTILKTIDGGTTWTPELSPAGGLIDVHTFNRNNLTVVGGYWNILAKRDETVPAFYAALTAVPLDNSARLEWSISADDLIRGYFVYRRTGATDEDIRLNDRLIPKEINTFTDRTVQPGFEYEFFLGVVFDDGSEVRSNVARVELPPLAFELFQNYPNPFNPVTSIRFSLPEKQRVALKVYDVTGRHVITLFDGIKSHGFQTIKWDARNSAGQPVSSGIYYYQLETGKHRLARKMVLIR